jgi:hypothetical protein
VSTNSLESPTESGLMPVTERAVENRQANRVSGEVVAHYQLLNSRDRGMDVYWVERLKGGWMSGHLVEISESDGQTWASCDCKWFLEFRSSTTVCQHICAAILMHRKRG